MSYPVYILDTSYLVEIAGCDGVSNPVARAKVLARARRETTRRARFYVPLPCLFELGDHIAKVRHSGRREQLVQWLCVTVAACLEGRDPWTITPAGAPNEVLPDLLRRFEPLAVRRQIGLVDTFAISEAFRLREELAGARPRIHIWTNDAALKEHEPDPEPDPYLW